MKRGKCANHWLFHLKVCHSVVEFNMGHGSSLAIQSQVSIHFLSSYMYTRQVKVRKWNQVGQCSYTIKVVDSEILPHPIMLSGNSQQNACIHIHLPNRRNEAPHLFSRNMLRCYIHCVSQYTNDLWFLQSFRTSDAFPCCKLCFGLWCYITCCPVCLFCAQTLESAQSEKNLMNSCSQVAEAEKTWFYTPEN